MFFTMAVRSKKREKPFQSPEAHQARRVLAESWLRKSDSEGVTQSDAAEALGCTPANFSHYLSGWNKLDADFVLRLCRYLGEQPSEVYPSLFEGVDLPKDFDKPANASRMSADALEIAKLVDSLGGGTKRKLVRQFVTEFVNGQHAMEEVKSKRKANQPS